jgi:choline monooxygenase
MSFSFDPSDLVVEPITRASTIPAQWYVDPRLFEIEMERVFRRSWQLVGRADQVALPGAYFTCEIGGEPVLVVRGTDGEVRALSNVCRHRGGPVARGEGTLRRFHCAYHGWAYNLDGSLHSAAGMGAIEAFNKKEISLPRFRVEVLPPLVFVTLDENAVPLSSVLGNLPEVIRGMDVTKLRLVSTRSYDVASNWKIVIDNFLECYHCPLIHRDTVAANIDLHGYVIESHEWYSRHLFSQAPSSGIRPVRTPEQVLDDDRLGGGAAAMSSQRQLFCFFPGYAVNLLPRWLVTFRAVPAAVDRTIVLRDFFCHEQGHSAATDLDGTLAYYEKVLAEDMDMVQLLQRQLRSTTYRSGRYSVQHEQAVHHFHSVLRRVLAVGEAAEHTATRP